MKGVLESINKEIKSGGDENIAKQSVVLNPSTSVNKPSASGINPSVAKLPRVKRRNKSGHVSLFG
jgi:hypothetical protein